MNDQAELKRKLTEHTSEVMLAQLTAMVANTGFKGWADPRKIEEFMPSEWRKKAAEKPKRRTRKHKEELVMQWREHLRMICGLPPK